MCHPHLVLLKGLRDRREPKHVSVEEHAEEQLGGEAERNVPQLGLPPVVGATIEVDPPTCKRIKIVGVGAAVAAVGAWPRTAQK